MKRYSKAPKTEKTEEQMLSEAKKWTAVAGAAVLLLAAVLLSLWVFPQKNDGVENTSWAMGSYVQQTLYGDGAEETATEAASAVSSLENLISWRVEDSDIDKLNRAAGTEWLEVDEKTMEVLEKALQVAQATDGAYDPTILPVSSLWNFDSEFPTLPEKVRSRRFYPISVILSYGLIPRIAPLPCAIMETGWIWAVSEKEPDATRRWTAIVPPGLTAALLQWAAV